eukprot:TRINITY_DN26813_c0_g1_i2.p1 TRINITY_DN26813_c0_g1~~TRINITY_DN26813_c0_g1_i2.p1  ORF type:complete len:388 (-),score=79.84 TRINITY_DN26813_c0_g1_i2:61-1224(-)
MRPIPELYSLLASFVATIQAIFWGFVMILLQLIVWSVIILQIKEMVVDRNTFAEDDRFGTYWCEAATDSTWNMILLLWQTLITGDSWGACMLPIILRYPLMYWLFAAVFVCIAIGFQNLILAVIVERANAKSEEDRILIQLNEKKEHENEIANLEKCFQDMDADSSGALSLEETLDGYDSQPSLQKNLMMKFGIDRSDLAQVIGCFDSNDTGEVSYQDIVEAMMRSERQEESTQLMMLQSQVAKLSAVMKRIEKRVDDTDVSKLATMMERIESRLDECDHAKLMATVKRIEKRLDEGDANGQGLYCKACLAALPAAQPVPQNGIQNGSASEAVSAPKALPKVASEAVSASKVLPEQVSAMKPVKPPAIRCGEPIYLEHCHWPRRGPG